MSGWAAMMVDGDGFSKHAKEGGFAILAISRNEVERGLIGDVVDRLMRFTDSVDLVNHYRDRLTVVFTGYDSDPRELYEIPECVSFFRALNGHWSHWFHFVEKEGPTIGLVLRLLCDAKTSERHGAKVGMEFARPEQFQQVMLALFVSMNSLYEEHQFSEAQIEIMSAKVMAGVEKILR